MVVANSALVAKRLASRWLRDRLTRLEQASGARATVAPDDAEVSSHIVIRSVILGVHLHSVSAVHLTPSSARSWA